MHLKLSIPSIGFWGTVKTKIGRKQRYLSIPSIGFRFYLFFFLVFKVFGMINSEAIMAQVKLALN